MQDCRAHDTGPDLWSHKYKKIQNQSFLRLSPRLTTSQFPSDSLSRGDPIKFNSIMLIVLFQARYHLARLPTTHHPRSFALALESQIEVFGSAHLKPYFTGSPARRPPSFFFFQINFCGSSSISFRSKNANHRDHSENCRTLYCCDGPCRNIG